MFSLTFACYTCGVVVYLNSGVLASGKRGRLG